MKKAQQRSIHIFFSIRDAIYDFETEAPRELYVEPYCGHYRFPNSMKTLDHLEGVSARDNLHIAAESGLKDAFLGLTGEDNPTMQYMSTRIAIGMAHVRVYFPKGHQPEGRMPHIYWPSCNNF